MNRKRTLKWTLGSVLGAIALGGAIVTIVVEREAKYVLEPLGGAGPARALVLYHPSRDAHFSEEISLAFAEGLKAAGFAVDRATLTKQTPARPDQYALIAVVSNTFWATPDLPTLRYLKRARLDGMSVAGLICGSGSTTRSERMLADRLQRAGATVLGTHPYWIMRPNDEARMNESNRAVARDLAQRFGREVGESVGGAANKAAS
jgi:hypothetical protein